jgi:hypothetical protein
MVLKTEQQQIFDDVMAKIKEGTENKWNMLIPSIPISLSQESLFVPSLEKVEIDPDPINKDIYQPEKNKNVYRLHAVALQKIASAGELKPNNVESGYFKDPEDGSIIFRAVGGVVNAIGNIQFDVGYYALFLNDTKDDLVYQYTEKAKKDKDKNDKQKQEYIDYCVNRDFRQKRAVRVQHCETCAKNRLIKKIFKVKNEYTIEQIRKPWYVLKYSLYMDYKDPLVKQMIMGMRIQAALGVYGISPNQSAGNGMQLSMPAPVSLEPFDPNKDPNLREEDYPPEPMYIEPEPEYIPPPIDAEISPLEGFNMSDNDEQCRILRALAAQAGTILDEVRLSNDPGQVANRGKLFTYLSNKLQDIQKMQKKPIDDIPV